MGSKRKKTTRRAYLKRQSHKYDPYSPYAIRTRGVKGINLAGLRRDNNSESSTYGQLISDQVTVAITHGARGLMLARAFADNPIPVAEVMVDRLRGAMARELAGRLHAKVAKVLFQPWQTWKYRGKLAACVEWSRKKYAEYPGYCMDIWFKGVEFIIFEEDERKRRQRRSRPYGTLEAALWAADHNKILWHEVLPFSPLSQ